MYWFYANGGTPATRRSLVHSSNHAVSFTGPIETKQTIGQSVLGLRQPMDLSFPSSWSAHSLSFWIIKTTGTEQTRLSFVFTTEPHTQRLTAPFANGCVWSFSFIGDRLAKNWKLNRVNRSNDFVARIQTFNTLIPMDKNSTKTSWLDLKVRNFSRSWNLLVELLFSK